MADELENKTEEPINDTTVNQEPNTDAGSGEAEKNTEGQECGTQAGSEIEKLNTLADSLGIGAYKELFSDNPDKFKNFILAREKELFSLGSSQFQKDDGQGSSEDKSNTKQQDTSAGKGFEKYSFGFTDEDQIDPKLRSELDKMNDHYSNVISSLLSNVSPVNGIVDELTNMKNISANMRFENALSTLGKDYEEFVGKGNIGQISQEHLDMRNMIYDAKETLKAGFLAKGLTPPDENRLVERAVRMVFAEKGIDLAKKKVIDQAKGREKQITNKPNSRKSESTLTAEERAAKVFDELRAKQVGSEK